MNAALPFAAAPQAPATIERGTPAYRRAALALFLAGFSTFSLLYCVQPLLPAFAQSFHLTAASSSLALSLTTGALAVSIFAAGTLSQALPRRALMFGSMALAALLNLAASVAPQWHALLAARLVEGFALGGVPAVAMTWLAEEMHPQHLGKAMGLYVSGTAFGGMMGRVGMGIATEVLSWRGAMMGLGALDLAAAIGFALLLPPSRHFVARRQIDLRQHARAWGGLLARPQLLRLFATGFVLTSVFVALFNYAGFRLSAAPYRLSQTAISLIFLTYVAGMFASPAAGHWADRLGRRGPMAGALAVMALGAGVTLASGLVWIVLGILLVTVGFFAAHAIASGWVGRLAGPAKSHAAALYLLFYYLGSSVVGSVGGWFWQKGGWGALVGLTGGLALLGVVIALCMREGEAARHG
jgi:MFS transporter, YNFM family, putative membrane transport protein